MLKEVNMNGELEEIARLITLIPGSMNTSDCLKSKEETSISLEGVEPRIITAHIRRQIGSGGASVLTSMLNAYRKKFV